jgi:hypothetical protein
LRVQGYRVSKVFAEALHEGTQKAFYFILGNYVERNLQYGLLHTDLTPRPAYVSFAAVGRFLNGAEPIGRVDLGNEKLMGYVFRTKVDGADAETLVTWGETKPTTIKIQPAQKAYDYLGRELPEHKTMELTRAPIFLTLPRGGSKALKLQAPPTKAKWLEGKSCPVVLQLIGKGDTNESAFRLDQSKQLQLVAYNFGDKPVRGQLQIDGASSISGKIEIAPGARENRTIKAKGDGIVTARINLCDAGHAIVSARVSTMPAAKATN